MLINWREDDAQTNHGAVEFWTAIYHSGVSVRAGAGQPSRSPVSVHILDPATFYGTGAGSSEVPAPGHYSTVLRVLEVLPWG